MRYVAQKGVIPAKAGIHFATPLPLKSAMDSRFRGNDGANGRFSLLLSHDAIQV
jgi:hypothetical protein